MNSWTFFNENGESKDEKKDRHCHAADSFTRRERLVSVPAFYPADFRIPTLQGNIDIRQVNVGFRITGRVKEMKLEEGDIVRARGLIATLDDAPYQDQVRLAEAGANLRHLLWVRC